MKKNFIAAVVCSALFVHIAVAQVSVVTPVGSLSITAGQVQPEAEKPTEAQNNASGFSLMGSLSSGVTIGNSVEAAQSSKAGFLIDNQASFKQEGATVKIDYQLFYPADIVVSLSTDGGQTFGEPLKSVSGHVGTDVAAGTNTIVWNAFEEVGELKADNVAFRVAVKGAETFTVNGATFTMMFVPGGEFTMGATDEQLQKPVGLENMKEKQQKKYLKRLQQNNDGFKNFAPPHQVTLSDFYIGQTEVTQGLWEAVMGVNIELLRNMAIAVEKTYEIPQYFSSCPLTTSGQGKNYAVYYVTHEECLTFIERLNELTGRTFRLPTEAEWEYVARGGQKAHGYLMSGSDAADDLYDKDNKKAFPVGTFMPNELGVFDMSGNVAEWCQDWIFGPYDLTQTHNPTGVAEAKARVMRGGSWQIGLNKNAARGAMDPKKRWTYLGFRIVLVK